MLYASKYLVFGGRKVKMSRICACLLLACLITGSPRVVSESPCDDYIRLHVVAKSDSAWDQGVKLAVRDAVREEASALLADCESADEAWALLAENADAIKQAARAALRAWAPEDEAHLSLGVYDFPERVYGGEIVPAGEYRAVRVVIGEGEGKNWWCVLFPSLCLPTDADGAEPVVFYSALGRWLANLFGRDAA